MFWCSDKKGKLHPKIQTGVEWRLKFCRTRAVFGSQQSRMSVSNLKWSYLSVGPTESATKVLIPDPVSGFSVHFSSSGSEVAFFRAMLVFLFFMPPDQQTNVKWKWSCFNNQASNIRFWFQYFRINQLKIVFLSIRRLLCPYVSFFLSSSEILTCSPAAAAVFLFIIPADNQTKVKNGSLKAEVVSSVQPVTSCFGSSPSESANKDFFLSRKPFLNLQQSQSSLHVQTAPEGTTALSGNR